MKKPDNRKAVEGQFKKRPDFSQYGKGEMKAVTVRLDPRDRERLEDYFHARGIKLSQGLRMAIKEWMQEKRIN